MWFLLRGVSWPYFKKHWVITLLPVAVATLGTGVYISFELSAASLKVSLQQTGMKLKRRFNLEIIEKG